MGENYKKFLTNMLVNYDDVLLHYWIAGFEKDENAIKVPSAYG